MSDTSKKTIGFIILVWNSENVIEKCLKSIIDLKKIQPRVVIVDNGSKDGTYGILRHYLENYSDIFDCIKYERNMGTTVSRNSGIRKIAEYHPDFYCILDSDTKIDDDAFLKMIKELENNSKYGIIGPTMLTSQGVVQQSARAFPTVLEKICKAVPLEFIQKFGEKLESQNHPSEQVSSYTVDYLMSACWLIRPLVLEKVGLLDENIFYAPEDAEYCIRVWKCGYQVAFCPEAKIIHEWQRLSKRKLISKINFEHIKGLFYMYRKHHYWFSVDSLKRSFYM